MEESKPNILFIGEGSVTDAIRCVLPAIELAKMEYANTRYDFVQYRDSPPDPDPDVDLVVFSRPHQDTLLSAYRRMGIPTIVDMDDDFHSIPEEHPGYNFVGPGDQMWLMKLENCMYLATHMITTTHELAKRLGKYRDDKKEVSVIPNGWSSRDPYWLSVRPEHHKGKLIIGWGGTITHREDFQPCIQPIKKIMKKYPETHICIALDAEIYSFFTTIDEKRKLFLPQVPYPMYPLTLSYWDIMLAPLKDTYFNGAKSDIKLVDAGAKGIPYIASNIPVYADWIGGGIKVDDDGWYDALEELVVDEEKRKKLAQEGYKLAQSRDMLTIGEQWRDVIDMVLKESKEVYD